MAGGKSSETGGVKPMNIAGRVVRERERLLGMSAEERAWRKRWLEDQVLSPKEPKMIPSNSPDLMNPIRRFYRFPLDTLFFKVLKPVMKEEARLALRFYIGRSLLGLTGAFATYYYFKYNTHTWESTSSWRMIQSTTSVFPGMPGYPKVDGPKKPSDYNDYGFKQSVFGKMIKEKHGEF